MLKRFFNKVTTKYCQMALYTRSHFIKSRYTPPPCFPDGNEGDIYHRNCRVWKITPYLQTTSMVQGNSAYPVTLNLDPGAISLPYEPDVDVRNYVDIATLMESYGLGPNGSLIMASDMIATKLEEIQKEVDELNPDYLIVDTPGQIELFAFRASGPYFAVNLHADDKATIFAFDGMLVSSPINFVSISLLALSVK